VHVLLLGSAAGGGFPQWNCWCPCCRAARSDPTAAYPRTQSSAAVSADGFRWFLLNASPDVRDQLRWLRTNGGASRPEGFVPDRPADPAVRHVPVEGVVVTDAEIDHTLGLVLLREAGQLPVYATPAVQGILEHDSHLLPVIRSFSDVPVTGLVLNEAISLRRRDGSVSGLAVEAFPVPAGPPRFASRNEEGHTVGLMIRDVRTGASCAFVPGCGDLDDRLLGRLAQAEAVLFDGTFWADDELIALGIGGRTARELDHVPITGSGGSLERVAALPCRHRVYTHINNTNPILLEQSPERAMVVRAGVTVGVDGLRFEL
jgi:pyrroloquinoline quinone biosynthesis protein B